MQPVEPGPEGARSVVEGEICDARCFLNFPLSLVPIVMGQGSPDLLPRPRKYKLEAERLFICALGSSGKGPRHK